MNCKPYVSIICVTYNHEPFIQRCIEGFLMQKTDFTYEIIIHDDASTDKTAKIVREYQKQYPQLIHAIIEDENQYSKDILFFEKLYELANGKYIALCEGDDYWIDDKKLQIQVDYMEAHPECSMTMHNAFCIYPYEKNDGKFRPVFSTFEKECDTTFKMQLCAGKSATASFVFRTDLILNRPKFFGTAPTGDDTIRYYMACCGTIHYFDRIMSIYNALHDESWNIQFRHSFDMQYDYAVGYLKFFRRLDDYTEHVYDAFIEERRKGLIYNLYELLKKSEMSTKSCIRKIRQIDDQTEGELAEQTKTWISRLNEKKIDYLAETMDSSMFGKKNIYIYGAGNYGNICAMQLNYCGVEVQGHVISDGQSKLNQKVESQLYYLSELPPEKKKVLLIIGVGKKNIKSVLDAVKMCGIQFYWPKYN